MKSAEPPTIVAGLDERLAQFDRYLDAAAEPPHRAMISNYRDHVRYEALGNVDSLLDLLTDDAEYHVRGSHELHLKGRDAIRRRYELLTQDNDVADSEMDLRSLMVSDSGIAGLIAGRTTSRGASLVAAGHPGLDPNGLYRRTMWLGMFRSFDGELAISHTYFCSTPTIEKLEASTADAR